MNIEFGLCAAELSEQLKEFNLPKETVDVWQGIADFIISAHISKAINDKAFYKCNQLLGSDISKTIKEYEAKCEQSRRCERCPIYEQNNNNMENIAKKCTDYCDRFDWGACEDGSFGCSNWTPHRDVSDFTIEEVEVEE